ncbi:glutamate ABC transporter substrate-binding protein [Actinomadura rudentiformis]|uniref:Glutamate ABC transporter substrate-binding protein n=1 Tax=Actinomadura rudentiformis TaxID=359158 RepID=A0A6H9YPC0_9ACTN|nr:glutamate ABC transporter substrate-binding protein [Actinomadura rudentiformis]KAB2341844.1 glutamate ABC transporter substrate-binding protein [Actinomadura rudentiformis]
MRVRRRIGGAALAAASVLGASACGIGAAQEGSVAGKDTLVIGVNKDQPGVGVRTPAGGYEGFDIDIAREVAKRLGVTGGNVTFKEVTSGTRQQMIKNGDVDLVVASYSITPDRKAEVTFAGPYYIAHQDVLVRGDSTIRNVRDLKDRTLCQVEGSVSYERVTKERGIAAKPVPATGYADCLDKLTKGTVDAVSTDDLILAGLAAQAARSGGAQGGTPKIVNAPISDENYGIGMKLGDTDGCVAVNKAITSMYQDGTAQKLLAKWFDPVRLKYTTTVPQFEGCE